MSRPITLFTGQWADLPFAQVCRLAADWGYDGLEIGFGGDHLDAHLALTEPGYLDARKKLLADHGLSVYAISAHLVGQAVCDHPIDQRHQAILPGRIWGDGEPEGVRTRAAAELKDVARVAAELQVDTVVGFTGSSIWHTLAMFPPVPEFMITAGYQDFADRWNPILDVFDELGVRFAHRGTSERDRLRLLDNAAHLASDRAPAGVRAELRPEPFRLAGPGPTGFLWDFRDRIYHVDFKDTKKHLDGRNGRLGSHLAWADPRRGWDFVSTGHGDVDFESCVRLLNAIGYTGPLSVEWEDAGMDRLVGAPDALAYVRKLAAIVPPAQSFDAAFGAGT